MNDAAALVKSMDDHPEVWKVDTYHAIHESGVQIWVGTGPVYIQAPVQIWFGVIDKCRIGAAVKRLKSHIVQGKLLCRQEHSI